MFGINRSKKCQQQHQTLDVNGNHLRECQEVFLARYFRLVERVLLICEEILASSIDNLYTYSFF